MQRAAAIRSWRLIRTRRTIRAPRQMPLQKHLARRRRPFGMAADEAAVAEALQQGKAALDTVPTDPNYNLNLDELNNALTAARAEAQKNGLYTAETISLLSKVISDTEGMLEYGFGSQTKVTETISRLENAVGGFGIQTRRL